MSDRRKSILKTAGDAGSETPKQVTINLDDENVLRRSARTSTVKKTYFDNSFDLYDSVKRQQRNKRTPRTPIVPSSEKESNINDENINTPVRRSSRKFVQSKKYSEYLSDANKESSSKKSQRTPRRNVTKSESEEFSDEENNENLSNNEASRPTDILFEETDVCGKEMFGFQSRKRRGGMAQKASEIVNSPVFRTPKRSDNIMVPPKTPQTVRNKIKKEIAHMIEEDSSEDDDYEPSDHSSSEENTSEGSSESDEEPENKTEPKILKSQPVQRLISSTRSTRTKKDVTYTMKTEEYFESHATSKVLTSNHTLQRLKNPKLSEDQLKELLNVENLNLSSHSSSIQELFDSSCNDFHKWMTILNEGFSILLYGLGSKRNILGQFHKDLMAAKFPVIIVNGYFPSLTIKDVLDGIYVDLLENSDSSSNVFEVVDWIKEEFEQIPDLHLYLIVHNIEGEMLRNVKSQNVLALLAAVPNIHLIASVDHINAPLIWNHSMLSKFNFIWWDATSLLPYSDETSFESSLLVQKSGALVLSSIASVYQSLTKNSKGIFMLIVKYQLTKKDEKHYQGMPFKTLYSQCRENFLVSSDLALRTQLTEFLDHKLVKLKRSGDGTEQLIIPINNTILHQFCEEVSNS